MEIIIKTKIYIKLFVFFILASIISSCVSYRYDYKSINKLNYIEIYNDPTITKSYSIGTYISVVGVPIGSSILLGNHAYQNAIENGSPKDTASLERNTIYGIGILAAGLGAYYLTKDTAYPKTEQLRDLEKVKDWYANTVDFDHNVFLGFYNKGKHTYVLSTSQEDYAKVYVKDISELRLITEIIDLNQNKNMLIKTVVHNSIDKIPSKDLFEAYIITDRKYPILLHRQLENTQNHFIIKSTLKELETKDLLEDTKLANLAAVKYLEIINKYILNDIKDWLNLFEGVHSIKIDSIRTELVSSKVRLEGGNLIQSEQLEVNNNIKSEQKIEKENITLGNCRYEIEALQKILEELENQSPGLDCNIILDNQLTLLITRNNTIIFNKPIYYASLSYDSKYGFKGSIADLTLNTSETDSFMKKYEQTSAPGYHNNPTAWEYKHKRFKEIMVGKYNSLVKLGNIVKDWNSLVDKLISKKHSSSYIFLETLADQYKNSKLKDNIEWVFIPSSGVHMSRVQKAVNVYKDFLKPDVVSNLVKSRLINLKDLNNISFNSSEEKNRLSTLLYDYLLKSWSASLSYDYGIKWSEEYLDFTSINLKNYEYIKDELDLNLIKIKHINRGHKSKLLKFLSKTHNKNVKARKAKLKLLEIGDLWDEGYIKQFNPRRSKVQIRVNYQDGKFQLKWIDFK